MTLVTPNLDVKVEKCIQDTNGRFLILDLLIDELHLILVNIYAPNDANQQVTFFKELFSIYVNELPSAAMKSVQFAVLRGRYKTTRFLSNTRQAVGYL